jgi:hypothetical protein
MSDIASNLGLGKLAQGFLTWASPGYRNFRMAEENRKAQEAALI